jgi:hypothetical protein
MATITLVEAADRVGLSPLEIAIKCAVRGFPCEGGVLDEGVLPIIGAVAPEASADEPQPPAEDAVVETDGERRMRVVRRVLERMSNTGKWMPARIERRAAARGLGGSDVGLALHAVDAMVDCGLIRAEQHGGKEQRVGLNGERRREIAEIVEGGPVADEMLRVWIAGG